MPVNDELTAAEQADARAAIGELREKMAENREVIRALLRWAPPGWLTVPKGRRWVVAGSATPTGDDDD